MAYVAAFLWGVFFAFGLTLAFTAVPLVRARVGPVLRAVVWVLCVVLFLVALEIPRATGLIDDAGWVAVVLFVAGMLCVEVPYYRHRAVTTAAARQEHFDTSVSDTFREEDFYDSPEAAALSGWAPVAQAHVLRTDYTSGRSATVHVDTVPSHPMAVICERTVRGWIWTSDVSA